MNFLVSFLAGIALLFLFVRSTLEDQAFTEYWAAEEELHQWRMSHPGLHPGDYPTGRALVERNIAASRTYLHYYRSQVAEESHDRLISLLATTRPQ